MCQNYSSSFRQVYFQLSDYFTIIVSGFCAADVRIINSIRKKKTELPKERSGEEWLYKSEWKRKNSIGIRNSVTEERKWNDVSSVGPKPTDLGVRK